MKKLLKWFDSNILTVFSFFLLVFIPLYPKIPLLEAIPGYIVRVRIEDFFVLVAFLVFLIQAIRKKASFKSIIFWPMVAYICIGFLSVVSAIYITKTIPYDQIHIVKALLHWMRRIEYFSIFYIFYNGIKNFKSVKLLLILTSVVTVLVSIYGYGQKYYYWPVYSTMNREFSKGIKLYLTEHARVPSTFGGHYDLAAFLVISLILSLSLGFITKKKSLKALFFSSFILGYWLMILSASRTSFLAYIGGMTILFIIFAFKKGWRWSLPRFSGVFIFSFLIMIFFGDLSDRFAHLLKLADLKNKWQLERLVSPFKPPPQKGDYLALDENLSLILDKTDERPVTEKPSGLPPGVYEDIPDYELDATASATLSGELGATMAAILRPVKRDFSDNAYKYGLSAAIRLDALWPWAIQGFKRNPLLGSGYSTLSKTSVGQFTEAESTDNGYLRALGETGLLGFITFFGIIGLTIMTSIKMLKQKVEPLILAFIVGFIAFTIGLLINAIYIDVFEASKVAFIFWALAGVLLAMVPESEQRLFSQKKGIKNKK
ncbi:hypothetical protein COT75_02840 [Candidatus Beckwithbacteria bacterium CG10_big_fil_rev_8_21_14_0_10_34_10]|uniref:O-antigen ligase domain-containing protein n=1 Tax=Candidatus Beckwithbacteria bacterium CG10_big_fil_rev_8_21_14_0_10_34_10 TaxID=1974495 RepID=A0A2H0W932_9BACT|nr:MAG: hypothetical protein COT75_02840 [Candidatus Beckwithbacteria bacterium CG10_big_fil_rev_8_21_14_0_10_34_10]